MLVDVEVGMYQSGRTFAVLRHLNGRVDQQLKLTRALALRSRENGRGKPTPKANSGLSAAQISERTDNGTERIVKTGRS